MRKFQYIIVLLVLSACGSCRHSQTETPEPPGELASPTGLNLDGAAAQDALAFRWDAVEGAESYAWRFLKGNALQESGSCTETRASFTGLEAGMTYKFDVKALAADRESAWSSRFEAKTLEPGEKPAEPLVFPEPLSGDLYGHFKMPAAEEDGVPRAFPGAEGGGMYTTGGRGGKVYHVTTLDDDTSGNITGSLRWALKQKGTRTIVFDVAGTIALKTTLSVKEGNVTIAGQTAPGAGICLKDYSFRIDASNVIVRYIRCRLGDEKKSEDDAMSASHNDSQPCSDIIIDHCSISWSSDECGSFYGNENFTLQYCILSESLRTSIHEKGTHGYGGLWGGNNASFHHNLLAHHDSRNPRFDHDYLCTARGPVHFINNVVYNWGGNSGYGGESRAGAQPRRINMVANWYRPGPASSNRARIVNPTTKCSNCESASPTSVIPGLFYVTGNFMHGSEAVTSDNWQGVEPDDRSLKGKVRSDVFMGSHTGTVHSAGDAMESVLSYAGASLSRDKVDTRIAGEVKNGTTTYTGSIGKTKGLIDSQSDAGGWPYLSASAEQQTIASTDSDADGIPDWYEVLFGLDREDASDAVAVSLDRNGRYTNLEMYLHYLVRDITEGENRNGEYKTLK